MQKTGGSTYVVSLPKKWIEREHLDKGRLVTLTEQKDGSVLVTPGSRNEDTPREIQILTGENFQRHLTEKYLLGYDILCIKSKEKFKEKEKVDIKKSLNRFIGLEIMEETADSITVHYLLDPTEVSILKTMRRMYTIVSVMHKDLITAMGKKDKNLLRDVIQRDSEVNRLYFLLVRQIRTGIQNPSILDREGITNVDCVDYRLVVKIIEVIGDNLANIARTLSEPKNKKTFFEFKKLAEETFEIHKRAFDALLKKDEVLAASVRVLRGNLKISKTKTDSNSAEILHNFKRIADFGQDLADIVVCE